MKTKERITKILSWWLIISMLLQMLPFSVISVYAQDNSDAQTVNGTLSVPEGETPSDSENNNETPSDPENKTGDTGPEEYYSGNSRGAAAVQVDFVYTDGLHDPAIEQHIFDYGDTVLLPELDEGNYWSADGVSVYSGGTAIEYMQLTQTAGFYTIEFLNGEIQFCDPIRVTKNDSIGDAMPGDPAAAEGYQFVGWFNGDTKVTSETVPASDMTVNSRFAELYTVIFTASDNVTEYDSIEVLAGEAIGTLPDAPAAPEGEGHYKFIGWFAGETQIEEGYEPTSSMTVTPKFVEYYIVTFYDRDARVYGEPYEVEVGKDIGTLPPAIQKDEDHNSYWAIGEIVQGGQGQEISVTGNKINDGFIPDADTTVVPDYDEIEHTVTFYNNAEKEDVIKTVTVTVSTNYGVNSMPAVPEKEGYIGKWVYADGDFTSEVQVIDVENLDVWPEYTKNIFKVSYYYTAKEGGQPILFQEDTYKKDDTLVLPPSVPTVTGKEFNHWSALINDVETKITGGEKVGEAFETDLVVNAVFDEDFVVSFIIITDEVTGEFEELDQYFVNKGEAIGTMPDNPFVSGKTFDKWVIQGTETEVTADTVVNESITVVAKFKTIEVYNITAVYFYKNDSGAEVPFNIEVYQKKVEELPFTIETPDSTKTDPEQVTGGPIYYAVTQKMVINEESFEPGSNELTVKFEYVKYTAQYDFKYVLKDLDGDDYTEIEGTSEHKYGVLGSTVTPDVKVFDFAVFESAEPVVITAASGQILYVKYTRKSFQLSYETNGSYVPGSTELYGAQVAPSATVPTRNGYKFAGWYLDEALQNSVPDEGVEIKGDTILYAAWAGDEVKYTIFYIKEVYNNDTGSSDWIYENSAEGTGTVGDEIQSKDQAAYSKANELKGYERDNGEEDASHNETVTVKADGSTVINVYYKLKRYKLVFNTDGGTIKINGQTYTGTQYYINDVVLGQDLHTVWPSSSTEIYKNNRYFRGWYDGYDEHDWGQLTKIFEIDYDYFEGANQNNEVTWTANWVNDSLNRDAYYWLQDPDGVWVVADEYTQLGLNTNKLSAKEIAGYTQNNGDATRPNNTYPESGNEITAVTQDYYGGYVQDDNREAGNYYTYYEFGGHLYRERRSYGLDYGKTRYNVTMKYTYNFYYNRAQKDIIYKYVDDAGVHHTLKTIGDVYYEAALSGIEDYKPANPAGKEGYSFAGWFTDISLQTPYTPLEKMPGYDLVLFAKFVPPSYTVEFIAANGGIEPYDSQTVEKHKMATNPGTPEKSGYVFDGWYTEADGGTLYDWMTQITQNTTVYAHWVPKTLSYVVHYVDENNVSVAPDKTVINPNFKVGQTITEKPVAVPGYRPQKTEDTLELSGTGVNQLTFVYVHKTETVSYTVRYLIAGGEPGAGKAVAETKTKTVSGDTASVVELAAAVDYTTLYQDNPELKGIQFFPDAEEKSLVLTSHAQANIITFYYSSYKNTAVTVNYVDMNGDPIPGIDPVSEHVKVGNTFTVNRAPIDGWELEKAVEGSSFGDNEANSNYTITAENAGQNITITIFYKRKLTITVKSFDKPYDGTALKMPADVSAQVYQPVGLLEGDALTGLVFEYPNADNDSHDGRIKGGITAVIPVSATISGRGSDYYAIRYISGSLEVTKVNVVIRIEPDRWTGAEYNGTEYRAGFTNPKKQIADYIMISHEEYRNKHLDAIWDIVSGKTTYDEDGVGLKYYKEAQTNVGNYPYDIALSAAELPETDNYSLNLFVRSGLLDITKKDLTITTPDGEKDYDGDPLTSGPATITGLVKADEGKVTVTATGTITDPGEEQNSYSIDWGGVDPDNYDITENLGMLKVKPVDLTVNLDSKEYVYDGTAHSLPTAATTNAHGGQTTILYSKDQINWTEDLSSLTATTVADSCTIYVKATNTKYHNTTATNSATLTINPRPVTFTGETDTKPYTGSQIELSAVSTNTGENTGLVGGHTHNVSYSAKGTEVGEYTGTITDANAVKIMNGNTDVTGNYNITTIPGKLTITPNTDVVTVTITGNSDTKVYNGDEQSVTGFTFSAKQGETTINSNLFTVALKEGHKAEAKGTNAGEYPMNLSENDFVVTSGSYSNINVVVEDGKLKMSM